MRLQLVISPLISDGYDCIYWNDVHENASLVARIRERANEVGMTKAGKWTNEWKAMIALDHLEDFKNKWPMVIEIINAVMD